MSTSDSHVTEGEGWRRETGRRREGRNERKRLGVEEREGESGMDKTHKSNLLNEKDVMIMRQKSRACYPLWDGVTESVGTTTPLLSGGRIMQGKVGGRREAGQRPPHGGRTSGRRGWAALAGIASRALPNEIDRGMPLFTRDRRGDLSH